jgi:hypothetical protein
MTVLAREDIVVQIHALQIMIEQFQLCESGHCRLENCIVLKRMSGSWDAPDLPKLSTYSLAVI